MMADSVLSISTPLLFLYQAKNSWPSGRRRSARHVSTFADFSNILILVLLQLAYGCHGAAIDDVTEQVDLDLLNGIVKGYSRYVEFVVAPTPTKNRTCSAQAVVRVDLAALEGTDDDGSADNIIGGAGGPSGGDSKLKTPSGQPTVTFNRVRLVLEYERAPRLWTVDVADTSKADGYGTPDVEGIDASFSETQIFNEQLRIYGNSLPGHREASVDGGHLLKVVDGIVGRKQNNQLVLDISDGRVEWRQARRSGGKRGTGKQSIESRFLYQLNGRHSGRGQTKTADVNITESSFEEHDDDMNVIEDDVGAVYIGFNRVVGGNFRSGSGLCRAVVQLYADTVDYCRHGDQTQCHVDAECYNVSRSHRCRCKEGFHGNGKTCSDVNECETDNGGCVHFCRNSHGGYNCSCFNGFQLDVQNGSHNCIDLNECLTNKGGCEHECVNNVGSFECRCRSGFFLASNGKNCVASNWCREHLGCSHHCHSTALGTKCICRRGFRLQPNGKDCIATCSHGNGGCQHRCIDRSEGPVCSCHENYILREDKKTCRATCALNNGECERRCDDTPDGPVCTCPSGFLLDVKDRRTCQDVDECSSGDRGGCSHECVNSKGSYECNCPPGFRLAPDGRTCHDINECAWNDTCDHTCSNTDGSYACTCLAGYEIYGGTHCADKNECSVNNGGCEHRCENTEGSYRCECHPGYRLHPNKYDCVEAVRCPSLRAPAKATLDCSTEVGSGGTELLACRLSCHSSSQFPAVMALTPASGTIMTRCGAQTGFRWSHELQNITLLSCSDQILAPGYKGRAKFMFFAEQCRVRRKNLLEFEKQLSPLIVGKADSCENDMCSVTFVDLKCDTRKRKFRHLVGGSNSQTLMSAEFEMKVKPATPTDNCGVECARSENLKRLRRSIKRLREIINSNREKFAIHYEGKNYEVLKKSLRAYKPRDVCEPGQVLTNSRCVACSLATWYNQATGSCEPCPAGTYQDKEGQLSCIPCPHQLYGVGVEGAKSVTECGEVCNPGSYSFDGLTPCRLCPIGTYQSDYGRTLCLQCGPGIITKAPGSTGFQDCLVNEHCRPGEYYSRLDERCIACPRDTYQPMAGQLYCIDCPGDTQTDTEGAISNLQCKDRTCKGQTEGNRGFIQSPNWPAQYPANIECTWRIIPEQGRQILIIVPEIHIASQDLCRDSLVMRQTASPYSLTTYEECSSSNSPVAFSARSQSLWIYFKTDGINSDKGFSIPYVTYSEEYQELIDDIVRDGRLYLLHQHQQVLKDGRLLSALLDVIAQPYTYYKYANVSQSVLPDSFVRILRDKVVRFFS